jgi:hypothetical protein
MRMLLKLLVILLALVVLLGIALAVRIYTWGRPLPVAYRQASRTPADAESGRSVAYLHVASNGGDDRYVTIDSNGRPRGALAGGLPGRRALRRTGGALG